MKPTPTPADQFEVQAFAPKPTDLIYFLLNVGDADAQVLLLPEGATGDFEHRRRAIIVDAGSPLGETQPRSKVPSLLDDLEGTGILGTSHGHWTDPGTIPLVVATHPHLDHIAAIPDILNKYSAGISEFWDPGYFHTLGEYKEAMKAVEASPRLIYANPTSGLRRWFGEVAVTVLSPSIQLRNRFDSYGIEVNDASISLKIDYPASRYVERDDKTREWLGKQVVVQSLILGADAQTLSWSYVLVDYPYLQPSKTDAARAIKAAQGADPLRAKVLKASHHASKHGVNLELVERVSPAYSLVSCDADVDRYHFPHAYAQEALREATDPLAGSGKPRTKEDWELGILYTSDTVGAPKAAATANNPAVGADLGSIAVVFSRGNQTPSVWRFGDKKGAALKFGDAMLM